MDIVKKLNERLRPAPKRISGDYYNTFREQLEMFHLVEGRLHLYF
ncbi:MAG: hypothetical protein ACQEP1_02830 [Nanobdellota archaeon]